MKKFLIWLKNFFIHFIRRILYFLTKLIVTIICFIIYIFTFEPNSRKKVTMRKIKRIRRLTKVKLWIWKNFGWYFRFIHDNYLDGLANRLGK